MISLIGKILRATAITFLGTALVGLALYKDIKNENKTGQFLDSLIYERVADSQDHISLEKILSIFENSDFVRVKIDNYNNFEDSILSKRKKGEVSMEEIANSIPKMPRLEKGKDYVKVFFNGWISQKTGRIFSNNTITTEIFYIDGDGDGKIDTYRISEHIGTNNKIIKDIVTIQSEESWDNEVIKSLPLPPEYKTFKHMGESLQNRVDEDYRKLRLLGAELHGSRFQVGVYRPSEERKRYIIKTR